MGIFTMTGRTITMVLTTVPFSLLLLAGFCLGQHFGYDEHDGPSTWPEQFPTCAGNRQSPINIEESTVTDKILPLLEICGPVNWHTMTVVNNGHTIMLKSNESSDNLPIMIGGPLGNSTYKFEQLHLHWGQDNSQGSETTINNKSFSMEMHVVFYKEEYKSMSNALQYEDGLAVVGYMYEVGSSWKKIQYENKIFSLIVKILPEVQERDGKEAKILNFPLVDLIKSHDLRYFTYDGSLTTPPCLQIVKWIVFQKPRYVSNEQVAAFRKMKNDDGEPMTHNFRPVQDLGDRKVYRNIPNGQRSGLCNKKLLFPWMTLQTLLGLFLFNV